MANRGGPQPPARLHDFVNAVRDSATLFFPPFRLSQTRPQGGATRVATRGRSNQTRGIRVAQCERSKDTIEAIIALLKKQAMAASAPISYDRLLNAVRSTMRLPCPNHWRSPRVRRVRASTLIRMPKKALFSRSRRRAAPIQQNEMCIADAAYTYWHTQRLGFT